eukprot:1407332-Amphidinium_carterae.1
MGWASILLSSFWGGQLLWPQNGACLSLSFTYEVSPGEARPCIILHGLASNAERCVRSCVCVAKYGPNQATNSGRRARVTQSLNCCFEVSERLKSLSQPSISKFEEPMSRLKHLKPTHLKQPCSAPVPLPETACFIPAVVQKYSLDP